MPFPAARSPLLQVMGTFECSVKLHPEVRGVFSVVIQKEKNVGSAKKK
jgi:large subunit ribosomal protein L9